VDGLTAEQAIRLERWSYELVQAIKSGQPWPGSAQEWLRQTDCSPRRGVFVESVKGVKAMFLLGVLLNSIITGTEREMVKNLMRAFHVHPIYWTILLLYYGVFIYVFAGAFYREFQLRRTSPEYREWLRRQRAERRRRKNGQLPPAKAGSLQERDVQVAKYR